MDHLLLNSHGPLPICPCQCYRRNLPLPRQKKFFSYVVTGSSIVVISRIIRFLPGACRLEFSWFLFIRQICPFTICPPIFLVEKSARAKSTDCPLLKNFPTISGLNALNSRQLRSGVPKPEKFVSYRNTNLLWLLPLNFHGYLEGYLRKLFCSSLSR